MIVQALDKIKQQTIISSLLLMIVGLVMLIIPVQHDGILVEILGYIILLVGGVIEEVMMRLFFMSLLVLIISRLFCKNEKDIPVRVFAAANIISALLFAAGHLPGTMAMTTLTPLLLFRCFLFNGGLGLCFGWLYRKYGIGYAMIAHGFAHLISDLLMVIFI